MSKFQLFLSWTRSRSRKEIALFLVGVFVVVLIGAVLVVLTKLGVVAIFVASVKSLGKPAASAVLFGLFCVCTTPFSSFAGVLSVVCGFVLHDEGTATTLSNVLLSIVVSLAGLWLGSVLTFLICRHFLRERTEKHVASTKVLAVLRSRVDFKMGILVRLGGIPIGLTVFFFFFCLISNFSSLPFRCLQCSSSCV